MSSVQSEIIKLEERLRLAELAPDPQFFEQVLADDVVLISQDDMLLTKSNIVEAHHIGKQKFLDVNMSDMNIIDHGMAAVVTCKGRYTTVQGSFTLTFMRVWLKKHDHWQIIAGSVSR